MAEPQVVSLSGALITASIGAVVAGLGWISAYLLTGWREDRTRRLQIQLDHTSAQSKEFYAPLAALTDQLDAMSDVLHTAREGKGGEDYHKLTGLFYSRFFLPLHEEINEILKTKMHLAEGKHAPSSFIEYFKHYATEKAYWDLTELGQDTSKMRYPPYPSDFYHDIREGYRAVAARHDKALQELNRRRGLSF